MINAIGRLGRRFTAEKMALELHRQSEVKAIRDELDELLCDARGTYSLSEEKDGQIVYEFPVDYQGRLYKKRLALFVKDHVLPMMLRLLKAFIGFFLLFSIGLCVVILILISLRSGEGRHHRGFSAYDTFIWWSFFNRNPFFYNNNNYYHDVAYHNVPQEEPTGQGMSGSGSSFTDDIFAFIFGPPRTSDEEERRWAQIRATIKSHNFVVTKDHMKPFARDPFDDQENFMAEICRGLGGEPIASGDGQSLKYRFTALQEEGVETGSQQNRGSYFREDSWIFCDRTINLPIALGLLNFLVLVMLYPYIHAMSSPNRLKPSLRGHEMQQRNQIRGTPGPVMTFFLQIAYVLRYPLYLYAFLFFAIPAIRYVICINILNPRIKSRNDARAKSIDGRVLGTSTS